MGLFSRDSTSIKISCGKRGAFFYLTEFHLTPIGWFEVEVGVEGGGGLKITFKPGVLFDLITPIRT